MVAASISQLLMTAVFWFSMAVFASSWFSLACKYSFQSLQVLRAMPQDSSVQSFHQSLVSYDMVKERISGVSLKYSFNLFICQNGQLLKVCLWDPWVFLSIQVRHTRRIPALRRVL